MTSLAVSAPVIDYSALAPLIAICIGSLAVLVAGLFKGKMAQRTAVPLLALAAIAAAADRTVRLWADGADLTAIEGAIKVDDLTLAFYSIFLVAAAAAVLLSVRHGCLSSTGTGEFHSLLLASTAGMMVLASAQNLVTLFIGLELLSIPLYVLCAGQLKRRESLESGLKYLIIGSLGSATLLYGLAFIYGATGSTDFDSIARAIDGKGLLEEPLLLAGVALALAGLAFKASVAPFHQWTPDVYQGAPTPVTAFMAVATKAAAFAVLLRLFDQALLALDASWGDALAVLAVVTIVVGNVGAIRQRSLKRMLGYSGIAQAGYMLAGVVVATRLGAESLVFYLAAYLLMNLAAFAVVVAREHEAGMGDDISSMEAIGRSRPLMASVMTVAMLSLAGFPATAGFVGKFFLIRASISGGYTWLAVAIVVGTMISLVYYLRVVAVMWLAEPKAAPVMAGGSPEADEAAGKVPATVTITALAFAGATLFFGIVPEPLVHAAQQAGRAIAGLP